VAKVKDQNPFERVITVTIGEEAIEAAKRPAARRLAGEIKIKGFRPGKAPLKVVESAVGAAALRREAIDDALPGVLTDALTAEELEPAVSPRLQDIREDEDGVEVDVRITLWPEVSDLPRYRERTIELDVPPIDDAAIEEQIERMRNQFADLEDVEREAFDGDFAVVDVTTTKDGEQFAAGSATDMLFEVGAGMFLEGMDDALRGSGAGTIREFTATLPPAFGEDGGAEVSVRVLVKQVKAKQLPELTDEWVDDMTEFETVAEMRSELADQMRRVRAQRLNADFERLLMDALVDELELELPEDLVSTEMDGVLHRFAHRLEQQGIEFERYLELTGQSQEAFIADLRSQAGLNLKTRILLEGVARAEEIEIDDAELAEAVDALARAANMEPADYRRALAESGQENTLSGDILRRKAVDRLLELAVPVDSDGTEIDLKIEEPAPEGSAEEADGDGPDAGPETSDGDMGRDDTKRTATTDDGHEPAEVDE
jgi:trigger factor